MRLCLILTGLLAVLCGCSAGSGPPAATGQGRAAAPAADAIGLTAEGRLLPIRLVPPRVTGPSVPIKGVQGQIVAIDIRPRTGELFGVSDRSLVYTIDARTGEATRSVLLRQRFVPDGTTIADFDPVTDRLRLMRESGANWLVSVDTGAVTVGRRASLGRGSRSAAAPLLLAAGAYTNSVAGAKTTQLYTIDGGARVLNLQSPPNSGVQQVRGALGFEPGATLAFDIRSTGADDSGWLLTGDTLFAVDLSSGRAVETGRLAGLEEAVVDMALLPVAGSEPSRPASSAGSR